MGKTGIGCWELMVRDPSAEGLLNALTEAEILFFGTDMADPVTVCFRVPYRQLGRVRRVLEQRGSELRLCRPLGPLPRLMGLGRRYALLGALGLCGLLLAVSNLFVWHIDVVGNETVPTGAVLRAMEEVGAGIGSFWPAFRAEQLKTQLLLRLEQVQWAAVNYSSGAIQVVIRERREIPAVIDNDEGVHVVAEHEGVVAAMSVKQGQPAVGVGDTVERGQLLISGAAASSMGSTRIVHALGSVQARTWHTLSVPIPTEETAKAYTGRRSLKISVILGRNRLNFYGNSSIFGDTCDTITMDYRVCMEGVFSLPIRLTVQQWEYWEPVTRQREEQALMHLGQEMLRETLRQRLGEEDTVVTEHFAATRGAEAVTVTAMCECLEEIGVEKPIPMEELRKIQPDNTLREEAVND